MTDPASDIAPDVDQDVRAAWNRSAPDDQWLVEVNSTDGYVIATNEKDRSFLRVPVLVGDGIEFGTPVPVVPGFVEMPVAASRVVFASRAESRPDVEAATATALDTPTQPLDPRPPAEPAPPAGPPVEPQTPPDDGGVPTSDETSGAEPDEHNTEPTKEEEGLVSTLGADVRSRLGLPDDADDTAILAALDAMKAKADSPPQPDPEQIAASAAKDAENEELRKEVTVLASQMQTVTAELAAAKAEKAATVKASVLDDAQRQGKFAPAQRDQWDKDYDEAPAAVTRILASIAPGTAVPVQPQGYTGTGDEQADGSFDADYDKFFRTEKAGA